MHCTRASKGKPTGVAPLLCNAALNPASCPRTSWFCWCDSSCTSAVHYMTNLACNPVPQFILHHIVEHPILPMLSCTATVECPFSEARLWRLPAYITTLGCIPAKTGKLVNTGAQKPGSLPMTLLRTAALLEIKPGLT